MTIKVVLEKRDQGDFKVSVPDLPGSFSIAMNEDEALENIEDNILRRLGIEKVSQTKTWNDAVCFKHRLRPFMGLNMVQGIKIVAIATLTGLFLMIAAI